MGERIGVSAAIEAPVPLSPDLCKALGAGNELGVYVAEIPPEAGARGRQSAGAPGRRPTEQRPPERPALEAVVPSPEGVQWHL